MEGPTKTMFARIAIAIVTGLTFATAAAASAAPPAADPAPQTSPWFGAMHWRSLGPAIGGRVVAIAGVPGKHVFYLGGVDGGVWRSTNFGTTWVNITDGTLPSSSGSIGAIAVAPSNANIIYVGTGESDIRADVITGDGVYRSVDAGKTWTAAGLADTRTISAIAVDPRNPDVVFASSMGHVFAANPDRGVFKSTDGGKSWKKVLFVDDDTGAIDLAMDPKHPDTLYATMWQAYRTPWLLSSGGPGSGLYKTTDGGAHWTDLTHTPGFPTGVLGRMGVAVAASAPQTVYLIAQAKDGGVFRSTNGGATWSHVNDEWKLRQRAFYYMGIWVDPTNANVVYCPNVDALWVSRDGAKTFARLRPPHGDNHIVWVDPTDPTLLLEGNDGGATVSTDDGKTWSQEHNQPTGQFYHVALDDRFPFHVFGAQQDEGSVEGPSAASGGSIPVGDWQSVAFGESTFVAPQPDDPDVTYGSGYFSIMVRHDERTGEDRSVSPWPDYQEGATSAELKYRLMWTHPILFAPADPDELLVGAQMVLKSEDHGETWSEISPDLTRNDPSTEGPTGGPIDLDQTSAEVYPGIGALAPSPLDRNVIWAGTDDGLAWLTRDGGAHWAQITPPDLPQRAQISCIEASHVAAGTAYLSASRYMWDDYHPYVYETTDYGQHWTAITSGLPDDEYVFAVKQDPDDANLLFAGTKNTVFVSLDGAASWQPLTLDLPHVQVRDIAIDTREGEVVVATHGRSFWSLGNLTLLEDVAKGTGAADAPQVFAPETAWLTHQYGASGFGGASGNGQNPPLGATVFFNVPSSYDGKTPVTLTFADQAGKTIRSFALHLKSKSTLTDAQRDQMTPQQVKAAALDALTAIEPGMNAFQWNLRYPDATEVTGFYTPVAAGGMEDTVNGPTVVPGDYSVTLDYGGTESKATFDVALDPGLSATPDDLAARFDLLMRLHQDLDALDGAIDAAIAERDRIANNDSSAAISAASALTAEIDDVVQLDMHSSEGSVLHEAKLKSRLAYVASDIDLAYARPTAAEYAVAASLEAQAKAAEQRLAELTAAAHQAVP
jgi:photosystem II stability/assembly factor-like uncharacterized protein